MSHTKSIKTTLAKSAHIVEGILLNLKCQSKLDEVTADTWSNAVNSIAHRLLQNVTGVHIPPLLIAAQMMAQTNEEIWVLQQWPVLLKVHLMRDGIDAHPWSCLHLMMAPEASSARAPSIEVIDKAGPSSTAVTAMAPPAIKVEQVVGDVEMGEGNSNNSNNNVVSKAIAKGKGKERAAIEEVGEDAGQKVMVKMVAKEAKAKAKAKEVGEERAVKQGKGKGKGKEVMQEEGVMEQTTVIEKLKNKGKWRESSKGTKKTRGRSQSTATSKSKSVELVPSDSEDEHTGMMPRGPS
ncbi:hypothetical protein PAXRUDRAFT_16548 [Paxillus rubicundulus Ve08.2h10]|uniref:Uncharacterized protein n=1 Tax=Paxillus rubicundulus Ve08.2h10 TaxID=930991 RepID=A0A0D0DE11_9AGAM|nr:hypothetical protein PAXRUDRAFT_16548 [Paxillus rubicundulus Ve08.2h10]